MGQRWDHFVTAPKVTRVHTHMRAQASGRGRSGRPTVSEGKGLFMSGWLAGWVAVRVAVCETVLVSD